MKEILVVCEDLRVNNTSAGIGRSKLIYALHAAGFKVKVITQNNFDYAITWLPESVSCRKFDIPFKKNSLLKRIPKVKAIPTYFTGFSQNFRQIVDLYKVEIKKELLTNKYDLIYAFGSGGVFAPHFALAELDLQIPFYVNIHDPYPVHLYPEPYKKKKTWINSLLEKKFINILFKAKGISFPSQLLMEDMAKTFSVIKDKGFVVPHIGTKVNHLPEELKEIDFILDFSKINILHAGTLLGPRNPKFLLQAIVELNLEVPEFLDKVCFTLIGNVNKELTDVVDTSTISNVRFVDERISYKKSLWLTNQATASLVIEAISDFSPFLPGKVADIAYAEKPIIALSPKKSEVRRLLGNDYPYQSELNDVQTIKMILLKFFEDHKSDNVHTFRMNKLKNYVSIENNAIILRQHLK